MKNTPRALLVAACVFAGGCASVSSQGGGPLGPSATPSQSGVQASASTRGVLSGNELAERESASSARAERGIPLPEPARDTGAAREVPTPQMPIPATPSRGIMSGGGSAAYIY